MKSEFEPNVVELVFVTLQFFVGSFAGLSSELRSGREITWRNGSGAFLTSGFFSVAIAMLTLDYFGIGRIWLCGFLSIMAGIGSATLVDFTIELIKKRISKEIEK